MQLSPFPCHLVSLRSKYFSQHPVLKHPQPAFLGTSIIFYLTTLITLQSDRFVRRQSTQHSALFQFALCRGPGVLVQCLTVNIRFLLTIFKERDGYFFLRLADTRQSQQIGLRSSLFVSVLYITRAHRKCLQEHVRITQCIGQKVGSYFS
jgi:hypothetical protein